MASHHKIPANRNSSSSRFLEILLLFWRPTRKRSLWECWLTPLISGLDDHHWNTGTSGSAESVSRLQELQCGCRTVFQSNQSPERRSSVLLHRVAQTQNTTQYTQETKHLRTDGPNVPKVKATLETERRHSTGYYLAFCTFSCLLLNTIEMMADDSNDLDNNNNRNNRNNGCMFFV